MEQREGSLSLRQILSNKINDLRFQPDRHSRNRSRIRETTPANRPAQPL
jgi:hypothetical protein